MADNPKFQKESGVDRIFNRLMGRLVAFGIGPGYMRLLEVRGRKSGKVFTTPVNLLELDGRPAYEVFAEAAGPLAADLRRALTYVFVAVPIDAGAKTIERGQFLVRNIVGAAVGLAGRGDAEAAMREVLSSGARSRGGPTAPPQGLCLERIEYDEEVNG